MKTKCKVCGKKVSVRDDFTIANHKPPHSRAIDEECLASGTAFVPPKSWRIPSQDEPRVNQHIKRLRERIQYLEAKMAAATDKNLGYAAAERKAIAFALRCISLCITNFYISTSPDLAAITLETDHAPSGTGPALP